MNPQSNPESDKNPSLSQRPASRRAGFQMSIRHRLTLIFTTLVFLNLIAVGVGALALNRVLSSSATLRTMGSRLFTFRLAYLASTFRNFKDDPAQTSAINAEFKNSIQEYEETLSALKYGSPVLEIQAISSPSLLVQVRNLESEWNIYRQRLQEFLTASPQNEKKLLARLNESIKNLSIHRTALVRALESEAKTTVYQSQILLIITLIFCLLTIPISVITISRIVRDLTQVTNVAREMGSGNFNVQAQAKSEDELGILATTLNRMAGQIGKLLEGLAMRSQELENTLAYLTAIIDNLADALLVTDLDCRITRTNPALRSMFKMQDENLLGQNCQILNNSKIAELAALDCRITRTNPALRSMFKMQDENLLGQNCQILNNSKIAELAAQTREHPSDVFTAEVELANGQVGQALATAIPKNGSISSEALGSVILIRDITAEKEIDRMKTDFISTVSHELRTPLTSVLGFASIIKEKLEEKIFPLVPAEDRKTQKTLRQVEANLNIIVSEAERLTSLINDVLDIAKMEAGKIEWHFQPIHIEEIVNRAIAATSSLFASKEVELIKAVGTGLPEVMGDRDRLIQVLINLISNASKFTEAGSCTVRAEHQDNEIIISVSDTGIGIAPEDQPKIFEKFKQVGETLTDKPKGTGLGLPICKQIVEHHGGKIWVESTSGQGSIFSFMLPLSPNTSAELEKININSFVRQLKESIVQSANPSPAKTCKTILVVDDDPHIRELLKQELGGEGYEVREAKDGMDAITQIKANKPDLILLDIMMPQINGFDVAAVLKNDPNTMDIPIIILSIIEDKERGYRLGVDRYLTKPINRESLLREIGTLLSQEASNRKVLVVDKDASTVRILSDVLQSQGYHVTEAYSGQECLEKAMSVKPDMIIIDSVFSQQHDLVKTLRFEKELENVLFFVLAKNDQDIAE